MEWLHGISVNLNVSRELQLAQGWAKLPNFYYPAAIFDGHLSFHSTVQLQLRGLRGKGRILRPLAAWVTSVWNQRSYRFLITTSALSFAPIPAESRGQELQNDSFPVKKGGFLAILSPQNAWNG